MPIPQTAADLLAGLLQSQLFADSIYGQVFGQSKPFLKHSAPEYAAALVKRKILTAWQARELLAGRASFYLGTFRLLVQVSAGPQSNLFVAEQSGAQRLVLLEATPLDTETSILNGKGGVGHQISKSPAHTAARYPHIARCLQVQTTATHHLIAYEFVEAIRLVDMIPSRVPKRSHSAHLVLQLVSMLAMLSREALETFEPQRVLIDAEGQLKWLPGPRALVDDWKENSSIGMPRAELQMLAIRKFSKGLGGLPEIAGCRNPAEVAHILRPIAEAWTKAFPEGSIPGTRAVLNRMLRKGPSLRRIESLHIDRQFAFVSPIATSPSPLALSPLITVSQRVLAPTAGLKTPRKSQRSSTSVAIHGGKATQPKSKVAPSKKRLRKLPPQAKVQGTSLVQTSSRFKQLLFAATIGTVVSGFVAIQWMWRGIVPEAKAHTESLDDTSDSSDKTR